MASNQAATEHDSDSDTELIFEDAVEDIKSAEQSEVYSTPKKYINPPQKESIQTEDSIPTNENHNSNTSKDTDNNVEETITDRLSSLDLDKKEENCNEEKGELSKETDEESGDDEETESCSDSAGEFDEDTVDELLKEATEEKKEREKEEDEEKEEEEEEGQVIDEELLKERDCKLTEEEKEELKQKAQDYKAEGNRVFKEGNYTAAIVEYTQALQACPLCYAKERSIMYSNRGASKLHLEKPEAAISDCTKAVELNPNYLKALLRRAVLYEKTDKLDEALTDYQKVLEMDPGQHTAREACMRLPEQIKERNEKMKDEMMGKLKDLGNLILRPFGLSTENFNLQQDPNTGGYSVNFSQGAPQGAAPGPPQPPPQAPQPPTQ